MEIQILDWEFNDILMETIDDSSNSNDDDENVSNLYKNNSKFTIRIFGRKQNGDSVSTLITNFIPFFYIKVYDNWKNHDVDMLEEYIKNKLNYDNKDSLLSCKLIKRHDFVGFTNKKHFKYVKLEFSNLETMNKCKYLFKYPIKLPSYNKDLFLKVYESNITPMLRFIHIKEISASGWIKIENYIEDECNSTHCKYNLIVHWKHIKSINNTDISPIKLASYDIEADSSHGDFPVAQKNYKKLSMNVLDAYQKIKDLAKKKDKIHKTKLENKNTLLMELFMYGFNGDFNDYDIEKLYLKNRNIDIDELTSNLTNVISRINPSIANRDTTIKYSKNKIYNIDKDNELYIYIYSIYTNITYTILVDEIDISNNQEFFEYFKKRYNEPNMDPNNSLIYYQNRLIDLDNIDLHNFNGKTIYITYNKLYKYPEFKIELNLELDNIKNETIVLKDKFIWQWNNGGWWLDMSTKESKLVERIYKKNDDSTIINIKFNQQVKNYELYIKKKILITIDDEQEKIIKIRRKKIYNGIRYNESISKIKEMIEEEYNIPMIQQILIFNGNELEDDNRLHKYNYFCGGILQLTIKPFLDEISIKRDDKITAMCSILNTYLPKVDGDKVIQIGTVIQTFGSSKLYKNIITLKGCTPIEGVEVESYDTEKEVLLAWGKLIRDKDPDIITGYNIFGFDYQFIWNRAIELGCEIELSQLFGRVKDVPSYLKLQNLSSSAYGDNEMSYITMSGRIQMDLLKVIQRDHNLDSYKLDSVSSTFIKGSIKNIELKNNDEIILYTDNIIGLTKNNYITLTQDDSKFENGAKIEILYIIEDTVNYNKHQMIVNNTIDTGLLSDKIIINDYKYKWGLSKDDVSPKDIFELQKKDDSDRGIIAKYCVQDCVLCIHLVNKLDIIINNMGMSNVCFVPLSYIFLRGQGIKTTSLVAEKCRKLKYLLPDRDANDKLILEARKIQKNMTHKTTDIERDLLEELLDILINEENVANFDRKNELKDFYKLKELYQKMMDKTREGYEGAIVLKPQPGIYYKPISVLDYASLYPSSMISDNLSHDTIVKVGDKYIQDGKIDSKGGWGKYDNLKDFEYVDVTYDNYIYVPKGKQWDKIINQEQPTITCRYVQPKKKNIDGEEVIDDKDRGVIPQILNDLLSARKNTRKLIKTEKDPFKRSVLDGLQLAYKITANSIYGQIGASTSTIYFKEIAASTTAIGRKMLFLAKDYVLQNYPGSKIVYGDTDSIFIDYDVRDDEGNQLKGKDALKKSIEMGLETENGMKSLMKKPHCLEYEKTFYPFVLISKKRYVGRKYEFDLDKFVLNAMGIVLKRRDNAPIVKYIYGGIIDRIMQGVEIAQSIDFLKKSLLNLLDGKFSIDYLIISKSLRSDYKNPQQIAHKVLADRMGERDPGNKPKPNDRIPYAYIEYKHNNNAPILQGDKVENPDYIIEHNLKLDYLFYITNQIMKPVCQIYGLIQKNPERIFDDAIRIATNKKNNSQEITKWFSPINNKPKITKDNMKLYENIILE